MKNLATAFFALSLLALVLPVSSVFAATPGRGSLYLNGSIVRTIVVPSVFPNEGRDNFYKVTNGVSGQLGIAGVGPGTGDYHGGAWKVFTVTFNAGVNPVLLTSQQAVLSAQNAGMVTVTRNAAADFRCPIQP